MLTDQLLNTRRLTFRYLGTIRLCRMKQTSRLWLFKSQTDCRKWAAFLTSRMKRDADFQAVTVDHLVIELHEELLGQIGYDIGPTELAPGQNIVQARSGVRSFCLNSLHSRACREFPLRSC